MEKTYKQLSSTEATQIQHNFTDNTWILLREFESDLSFGEKKYFERGFQECDRMGLIYGLPKILKMKKLGVNIVPMRPVTSQCGTPASVVSKFIDEKL